jgi:flagellar biosynthesis protein
MIMGKKSDKSRKPKAVALRYKPLQGDKAPKVVARGSGRLAEKMIELARENEIPVEKDPDLVEVLSKLDIDQEIPPDVYVAVAELLAFVYRLNREKAPL